MEPTRRHGSHRGLTRAVTASVAAALFALPSIAYARLAPSELVPPPAPAVALEVPSLTELDRDGNQIDDAIDAALIKAYSTIASKTASVAKVGEAFGSLDEPVEVQFSFRRPITQSDIDAFLAAGGEITHIYKATAYGWNGLIARGSVPDAVASMDNGLNAAIQAIPARLYLYNATRNGRARAVWPLGYRGNSNITVAILDDGVSESHTDLNGRRVFWHDYTTDAAASPIDLGEHGTHVTGIAVGTGQAMGANPSAFFYSDSNPLPVQPASFPSGFYPTIVELPTPSGGTSPATIKYSANTKWQSPGSNRAVRLGLGLWETVNDSTTAADDTGYYGFLPFVSDSTGTFSNSPSTTFQSPVVGTYSSGALKVNTPYFVNILQETAGSGWGTSVPAHYGSVATTFTAQNGNVFSVGDNYNLVSGVAPLCKWAGFKVFKGDGTGSSNEIGAALDDLAVQAQAYNIKVANMSLGLSSSFQPLRVQTNNAVNAGVFIAVAEGNDGPAGSPTDPARAGLAMTVGASNPLDQLTDYTTLGFSGGTDTGGDAIKPDIIAPGGSFYYGYMVSVDSNDSDAMTSAFPDNRVNDYKAINGTSMASPFVAGAAALVIDAWQQTGHVWQFGQSTDPLFVKMLLCATATETNQQREWDPTSATGGTNNPTLGRAATPKDGQEGYGLINVDAAIECLRRTLPTSIKETLGSGRFDKRASGFSIGLTAGVSKTITLTVPAGADYDLYLYSAVPGQNGNPQIVASSTTNSTTGNTETITYKPSTTGTYYVVVKRVSGGGQFTLAGGSTAIPPTVSTSAATNVTASTATLNGTVNPNGQATTYFFEYGLTTAYGSTTTATSAGSGSSAASATAGITGLASGTLYHARVSATNAAGTSNGSDVTFTTCYATADVVTAMKLYAGVLKSAADATRLNIVTTSGSTSDVDMLDIVRLARKVAGKDTNP